jgi:translation elongation factor EF-G
MEDNMDKTNKQAAGKPLSQRGIPCKLESIRSSFKLFLMRQKLLKIRRVDLNLVKIDESYDEEQSYQMFAQAKRRGVKKAMFICAPNLVEGINEYYIGFLYPKTQTEQGGAK